MARAVLIMVCCLFAQQTLQPYQSDPYESLRRTIETALDRDEIPSAIDGFSALVTASRSLDHRLLDRIAYAVVARSLAADDLDLELAACGALLARGPHPCLQFVADRAAQPTTPLQVRVDAAALVLRMKRPGGPELMGQILSGVDPQREGDVLVAARRAPPKAALTMVAPLLKSGDSKVQVQAWDLMATTPAPGGLAAVRTAVAANPHLLDAPLTRIALARQGDTESVDVVAAMLGELDGTDLLGAGEMLLARDDPRGADALRQLLGSPDELIRLRAAAVLAARDSPEAQAVIEEGLANENPWVRLHALEIVEASLDRPARPVWELMKDSDPWIRFRAAAATLAACRRLESAPRVVASRP